MNILKLSGILLFFSLISCKENGGDQTNSGREYLIFHKNLIGKNLLRHEIEQIKGYGNFIVALNYKAEEIEQKFNEKEEIKGDLEEYFNLLNELYSKLPIKEPKNKKLLTDEIETIKRNPNEFNPLTIYFITTLAYLDIQEYFDQDLFVYNTIDFAYNNININDTDKVQIFPIIRDSYAVCFLVIGEDTISDNPNGFLIDSKILKDSLEFEFLWRSRDGKAQKQKGKIKRQNDYN